MTRTPAGWYDDGHGGMRWWDGTQWTEHVAVPAAAEPDALPSASPYWGGEPAAADWTPSSGHAPALGAQAPAPAATSPKSRLWIVWVVLGVILLGAVLTYLFGVFSVLSSTSGETSAEVPSEAPSELFTEEPAADPPATPQEQAAVDTVLRYNDAWLTGDCAAYFETTTAAFRADVGLTDCELFMETSQDFVDSVEGYETLIRGVVTRVEMISVSTTEAYSSTSDAEGNDTGVPVDYEDLYEYEVVISATGGWAINFVG